MSSFWMAPQHTSIKQKCSAPFLFGNQSNMRLRDLGAHSNCSIAGRSLWNNLKIIEVISYQLLTWKRCQVLISNPTRLLRLPNCTTHSTPVKPEFNAWENTARMEASDVHVCIQNGSSASSFVRYHYSAFFRLKYLRSLHGNQDFVNMIAQLGSQPALFTK